VAGVFTVNKYSDYTVNKYSLQYMRYTQQDNGKWKGKTAFHCLQVFGLAAGN